MIHLRYLALLPIVVLAAGPRASVDDLLRRGNDAFAAKDYQGAIRAYEQAEGLTTDPGLVAFNKAAALYQLALAARTSSEKLDHFRQAAQHYRCAAEDVYEPRRDLARFGLANSLLQGRATELDAVKEAVAAYRDLLNRAVLDASLTDDARHNLEVAKLLLLKLQAKSDPDKPKDPGNEESKKPPPDRQKEPLNSGEQGDPRTKPGQPRATGQPAETKDGKRPIPIDRTEAGKGDLKPLHDEEKSPPLSAREAGEELDLAVERILLEQRSRRDRSSRFPPGVVKDW